ncbi:DUF4283 domain-containing protein [Citrus sinensis]|uniref:DUF4283 domain-containing protein n=1 Tax=Citrus sinensis TaxID=2711 RepID=A0ACB8L208_CITSI|nr:DUF4283 domain-containing protein [Citrus sinensis]
MSECSENAELHENPNLLKVFPPSLNEDRSTKKARFRSHGTDEDNPTPLSFKEALAPSSLHRNFDDAEMEDDWDFEPGDVMVGEDGTMPTIVFSKRVHDKLIKPWQNSVVVKLLGRNIGYKVLCNRLKVMWPTIHDFSVIDLENNYYLVRLHSPEDAVYALTEGPWVIFGHYLTVQPWTPQFDSTVTDIASDIVWIRLPSMAFHLYDKRVLRKVGQLVGTIIKIDYHTESRERGKFARIAVRVSLSQPLVSQFNLDGKIQKVEYEGLPIICYQCGKYGHTSITCPEKQAANGDRAECSESFPTANVTADKDGVSVIAKNNGEKFGPWMIMARRGKPKVVVDKENITDSERNQRFNYSSASRFAALIDEHDTNTATEFANHPLKTLSTLKPHNHLSKAKQVAKSQLSRPKQQNPKPSTSMHANLRPNIPKDHSTKNNVPSPNPLGHPLSLPVEPSFILTTLDPHKHTAVTFPMPNHEIVGNPPGYSCGKVADNSDQQLYPRKLAEPPDGQDDGTINPMEFYGDNPQLAFGYEEEDIMSDDENTIVNETPGVEC